MVYKYILSVISLFFFCSFICAIDSIDGFKNALEQRDKSELVEALLRLHDTNNEQQQKLIERSRQVQVLRHANKVLTTQKGREENNIIRRNPMASATLLTVAGFIAGTQLRDIIDTIIEGGF